MSTEGSVRKAIDPNLIQRLLALLPVPIAVVDANDAVVLANSAFNEAFADLPSLSGVSRRGVSFGAFGTFDIEELPLDETHRLVYGADVTSELQIRRQVLHLEKMASIGRLVSGVAHELNNPLAGILGYAQLVSKAELDPTTRKMIQVILNQAERASRIAQNFLKLAAKSEPQRIAFDVNEVVRNVAELRAYDQGIENITTALTLDPQLPPAFGDPGQIEQVILNLVINAEDAVLSAGRDQGKIAIRTFMQNGQIHLTVMDNGSGIPAKDIGRIFDPFFTTKDRAKGTGLGLSICTDIVRQHDGQLYAWSTFGDGSTFTIELPAGLHPASAVLEGRTGVQGHGIEGRSILVIDDESAITQLVDDVLTSYGARVQTCNSGVDGLHALRDRHFDLVICDQRMPGLNGQSVYRMAESLSPQLRLRFLFITGDVVNTRTKRFFARTGVRYLRKPFRVEELLDAVSELFDVLSDSHV